LPEESAITTTGQPKLTITQGANKGGNIHCGILDKAGNLWFGTTGEGVYKYDGKSFIQYTVKDGLSDNTVNSILEDKAGNIWFSTDNGASRYDGKKFIKISIFQITGPGLNPDNPFGNQDQENSVWNILEDKAGKFWFGTTAGMFRYDAQLNGEIGPGKPFSRFSQDDGVINNSGAPVVNVESMLEDKSGNVWFGGRTSKGVFRFDGKSITQLKPDSEKWFWPVLEDSSGNIWLSNWSGVCRFDGKSFVNFSIKNGLCNGNITCIIEDKNHKIWFGSDDGGICRFDARLNGEVGPGKSFQKFGTAEGLPKDGVWCMVEDKAGNIWVGTRNFGLYRYDGKMFTKFSE
jgi:ligand-binding sensor domain-containing protein